MTGGYVYRGRRMPALVGTYIYGDYVTGNLWGLRYRDGKVVAHKKLGAVSTPASFGEDREGELYITSFDGRIYKLVPKHGGR